MHVIVVLAAFVAISLAAAPSFNYYTMDLVFSLPYNGISEPIRIYYDGINNKSRTEYYNGQDVYIYLPLSLDFGVNYQVVPVSTNDAYNTPTCFQNNGSSDSPITIQTVIPDLSIFQNSTSLAYVRGILCENWFYNFTYGSKVNTYNFYVSVVSGAPVQYHMMGYDSLFGSHYDEYILNYNMYSTDTIDASVFDAPDMDCGSLFGANTRGALAEIESIPQSMKTWDHRFEGFKSKYNKKYESEHEHEKRKTHFRNNYRYVESMNHQGLTYKLAINHFADISREERLVMNGHRNMITPAEYQARLNGPKVVNSTAPTSWDWRTVGAVTPVKDQGMCGSCWSFGTAESIEGAWFIETGELVPISEQAFMDCSWGYGNDACDGGFAPGAYQWAIDNGGNVPSEASYGLYEMADGLCHADDDDVQAGAHITGYVNVTADVDTVVSAIFNNGPLAVAIDASHESFVFYSSGVYYEPSCGNTPDDLDHEVLAIGYGTAAVGGDYWIVKNSWSSYWGDNGFVLMSRTNNNCGVATSSNYPIVEKSRKA